MCTRWKPSRQHELRKGSWRSHRCLLDRATLCRCRVTLDVWRFLWINKALSRANWARRSRTTRNCKWFKTEAKGCKARSRSVQFPWCRALVPSALAGRLSRSRCHEIGTVRCGLRGSGLSCSCATRAREAEGDVDDVQRLEEAHPSISCGFPFGAPASPRFEEKQALLAKKQDMEAGDHEGRSQICTFPHS